LPSFGSLVEFFATWWGVALISALDSSLFFFVPFGADTLVVYMAARNHDLFWLYPLLAAGGSTIGAAVSFWIGARAGEAGLDRFVSRRRLDRLKKRVHKKGTVALAMPAILPPPFPLTAFVLTSGALEVSSTRFFAVFVIARLLRFGGEGVLAFRFGTGILNAMQTQSFLWVMGGFIVVAVVGTAWSLVIAWRRTRIATAEARR
jgi:membrane protein YqaA with SNARE-associated domain